MRVVDPVNGILDGHRDQIAAHGDGAPRVVAEPTIKGKTLTGVTQATFSGVVAIVTGDSAKAIKMTVPTGARQRHPGGDPGGKATATLTATRG